MNASAVCTYEWNLVHKVIPVATYKWCTRLYVYMCDQGSGGNIAHVRVTSVYSLRQTSLHNEQTQDIVITTNIKSSRKGNGIRIPRRFRVREDCQVWVMTSTTNSYYLPLHAPEIDMRHYRSSTPNTPISALEIQQRALFKPWRKTSQT